MKYCETEKANQIARRLGALQQVENETLSQIIKVIAEKVEFYEKALKSWDNPHERVNNPEDINIGRKCCNAGLDMAAAIVNELRILYLQQSDPLTTTGRARANEKE